MRTNINVGDRFLNPQVIELVRRVTDGDLDKDGHPISNRNGNKLWAKVVYPRETPNGLMILCCFDVVDVGRESKYVELVSELESRDLLPGYTKSQ